MKKIALLILLCTFSISFAQKKKCSIDYEIKNDSVDLVKINEVLIFEKHFYDVETSIFFSMFRNKNEYVLQYQWLEKSKDFTINRCLEPETELQIDLINSQSIHLKLYDNEVCSQLIYDKETDSNLRILSTYFRIEPEDLKRLQESRMSLLTVYYAAGKEYYNIQNSFISENSKKEIKPANFFIDNIPCLKDSKK